jgi:hypothetical protein
MLDQLRIGDVYSYDSFFASVRERSIGTPKRKTIKETVPFSNLTYDFSAINGEVYYEERTLQYIFEITADTPEELERLKAKFASWVMNVMQVKLYDPFIKDYHFLATYDDMSFDDEEDIEKTTATVQFTAYPYKIANDTKEIVIPLYAYEEATAEIVNLSSHRITPTFNSDIPFVLEVNGNTYGVPSGEIRDESFKIPSGATEITVKNNEVIYDKKIGKEIVFENSASEKFKNIVANGDSIQNQYEGHQLFDENYLKDINNYDTTTLHGSGYDIAKVLVGDVGTVTVSIGQKSNVGYIRVGNVGEIGGTEWLTHPSAGMSTIRTFDVVDGYVYFLVEPYVDLVALVDSLGYIQINEGAEAKPHEPYVGNAPSPSPQYPQPIVSSGQKLFIGENLFDISKIPTNASVTNNGDGTLTVKHAAYTEPIMFGDIVPGLKVGETYILNADSTGTDRYFIVNGKVLNFGETFVVTEDMLTSELRLYASYNTSGGSTDDTAIISNIRINKGTADKGYDEYTGGVPKVIDVGVEVKVYGKNQLDESDVITSAGGYRYCTNNEKLFKGGQTYTIKTHCPYRPDGLYVYVNGEEAFGAYGTGILTFTFEEDTHGHVRAWWSNDSDIPPIEKLNAQLEFGEVATEYEPYTEQTLTIPYVLRKGDKVEYASGKRTTKRKKLILKGDDYELWSINEWASINGVTAYQYYNANKDFKEKIGYCTHFRNKGAWDNDFTQNDVFWITSDITLIVKTDGVQSLEDFKAMLAEQYAKGTPVTIEYESTEPIITDLTEADIQAYKALQSNEPTTTIMSDAELEVECAVKPETPVQVGTLNISFVEEVL